MIRTGTVCGFVVVVLATLVGGCQGPKMAQPAQPPQRPAELDRLAMFVGTWDDTWEMKPAGSEEAVTGHGVYKAGWEADKWVLVGRYEGRMDADEAGKVASMDVWAWDARTRKYRAYSFDNSGAIHTGTPEYDEDARTWRCTGTSYDAASGREVYGETTLKMVDEATMEWEATQWSDVFKFRKLMEMKGTSRRR